MSGLGDALEQLSAAPVAADHLAPRPVPHPKGWEPGVRYDPAGPMVVTTTAQQVNAQQDYEQWRRMVEDLGVTIPSGWRVRLAEAKYDPVAWTRDTPDQDKAVTRAVWRYKFVVEPAVAELDIEDLVKRVRRFKASGRRLNGGEQGSSNLAYLVAMGDTQVGKLDGDGPSGTVDRVLASIEAQAARLKELRRLGRPVGDVYLTWLGDCIEGFVGMGGAQAWRTQMPLVEQVRVVRRLMLHQVETFRGLADRVVLVSIPGNHDEAVRFGKGGTTRYGDSWAVEAAVQVGDALAVNPTSYGHVSVAVPGQDELTLTLDVAGTTVGLAHGHQISRGGPARWWADQAHGQQPIGGATLLLIAHLHHLRVEQGGAKTVVQVPSYESESTWWRHRAGQVAPTGAVTMLVGGGGWDDLRVV